MAVDWEAIPAVAVQKAEKLIRSRRHLTSEAGNDTVRLFSQLQDFGLLKNVTLVGAAGVITPQNMSAVGKAACTRACAALASWLYQSELRRSSFRVEHARAG